MNERLNYLIKDCLLWDISDISIEYQQDGLTNQNYIISKKDMKYAVRICGSNSDILGINRHAEYAAMKAAAEIGIGAELIYYSKETGDMITKFIAGKKWTNEDTTEKINLSRIADTMKKIHQLPSIPYCFSPYRDIEDRIQFAIRNNLALPDCLQELLDRLHAIEKERQTNQNKLTGLCHNDPFSNNFIEDESVRLIDWEFAGMGDIYFDLASICMFYPPETKALFLENYFGYCDEKKLEALEQMTFVVAFWNAMWAVIQAKLSASPHDYEAMANGIFMNMKVK
jgi:thiamine kinase-like enzyme